jgi:hypothetical protein
MDIKSAKDIPGPGNYNIPNKLHEGPDFSISAKPAPTKTFSVPGPGAYDPKAEED